MRNVRYWCHPNHNPASTYEEAIERLMNHHVLIAVDTETIGLKGDKSVPIEDWDEFGNVTSSKTFLDAKTIIGIGVAISPYEAFYFPLGRNGWTNVPKSDPYPLTRLLANPSVKKIFFNSMFDLERIRDGLGVNIPKGSFADVAIACQVQGLYNSLDVNSSKILGEDHVVIDDVLPKGKTMLDVPFMTTSYKCICDCISTFKLYQIMELDKWSQGTSFTWEDYVGRRFDVTPQIQECYQVDLDMVPLLQKMSHRGFALRPDVLARWFNKLKTELQYYDDYFHQWGINPQSNDQVGWLLASRGNYVGLTDSKKHMKVNEEALLSIKDPVGYMVLARRHRQKFLGTYVIPFMNKARAYSNFRLDLATGRLGSWGFNSQNFPPKMREIFEADCGLWTWADLHQAEMRVWANQSQDEVMLEAFRQNSSPHVATLKYLFPGVPKSFPSGESTPQYVDSKSFNFALLADASADVLARTTKRPVQVVQGLKDKMYELYWKSKLHQDYMRQRHTPVFYPDYVESDFGRRCHIPDLSVHTNETHQEKCRLNYPFQSTVADVVKRIMLRLDEEGMDFPCQVHDEILQDGFEPFPSWMAEVHPSIPMPFEVQASAVWV